MAERTVANQARTIVTRGTPDQAHCTSPDVCKVDGASPAPFDNYCDSEKLTNGTTNTLIAGKSVWIKSGQLGPSSDPVDPGKDDGVKSGTCRQEATATSFSKDVFMEDEPVVRMHDTTYQNHGNTVGIVMAANLDGEVITQAECASLWAQYQKEAQALLDPVDHDHRLRNRVISGAYADLYLGDSQFTWAGLAAYASKQVGCAMDHAAGVKALGKGLGRAVPSGGGVVGDGMAGTSQFLINKLGHGNRALFLDIYPPHLFFRDHGFDKMARCASARQPPLTPELLRGFKALEDGDANTHLTEIAYHEQVNILQEEVYNSTAMRRLLDVNQARFFGRALPLTQAPDVTMSDSCDPNTGATIAFPLDEDLYDVPARMDWILNEIGGYYQGGFEGSDAMYDHLRNISSDGASAAGASGGGSGGGGW